MQTDDGEIKLTRYTSSRTSSPKLTTGNEQRKQKESHTHCMWPICIFSTYSVYFARRVVYFVFHTTQTTTTTTEKKRKWVSLKIVWKTFAKNHNTPILVTAFALYALKMGEKREIERDRQKVRECDWKKRNKKKKKNKRNQCWIVMLVYHAIQQHSAFLLAERIHRQQNRPSEMKKKHEEINFILKLFESVVFI